jgi:TPP-dependent pyruvate/acetoin dehydrogenase alpha subunit
MASKSTRAVMEPEAEKNSHPPELLLNLYRMLVKCRMCDEKARILFRQGKYAGNFYSSVGQAHDHLL